MAKFRELPDIVAALGQQVLQTPRLQWFARHPTLLSSLFSDGRSGSSSRRCQLCEDASTWPSFRRSDKQQRMLGTSSVCNHTFAAALQTTSYPCRRGSTLACGSSRGVTQRCPRAPTPAQCTWRHYLPRLSACLSGYPSSRQRWASGLDEPDVSLRLARIP